MFTLLRVIFLTVFNAYRPVIGRPRKLSKLVVLPVLVATSIILGVVPFAQKAILVPLELQPAQVPPVAEQLTQLFLVFTAEMLALVPWLWLASVLMMNWPQIRHSSSPPRSSLALVLQGKVWKSTAFMMGVCVLVALPFEALYLSSYYHAATAENVSMTTKASVVSFIPFMTLVLLSRYGLVVHGMSIGRRISIQQSRWRLKGRSLRLFFTFLLVVGAALAIYSPIANDAGWSIGPMQVLRGDAAGAASNWLFTIDVGLYVRRWGGNPIQLLSADVPGTTTNVFFVFAGSYIFYVFVFALAVCAISEVIARAYSATKTEAPEPQSQAVPTPA